jgi:hypothetical protein
MSSSNLRQYLNFSISGFFRLKMSLGFKKSGQVHHEAQEAPAVFPEMAGYFPAPLPVCIKTFDMPVVQFIQSFFRVNILGYKDKIKTIHQTPIIIKMTFLMDGRP